MRRHIERERRLESATVGSRLSLGATSDGADSCRRGRRDSAIHSKAFKRIVSTDWFLRCHCAWLDFHDAEGPLLCTNKSVLRVVRSYTALFFRHARLGNVNAQARTFAVGSRYTFTRLGR